MSPIALSLIALAVILAGALFGALLRKILPDHHLADDTKDYVRLGTGLIATIAGLVLGLLIASAHSSYDSESSQNHARLQIAILLLRDASQPFSDQATDPSTEVPREFEGNQTSQ